MHILPAIRSPSFGAVDHITRNQLAQILAHPDPASRARRLLARLAEGCDSPWEFGPFTVSLYDTAWLAMITKPDSDGQLNWLFPESFDLILREQREDGSWDSHACHFDGVINGLAGLLCLAHHRDSQIASALHHHQLARRITKAKLSVEESLQHWEVADTPHVGFEMIIPALLRQLEQHDVFFAFPAKSRLMAVNKQKLGNANVKHILRKIPTLAHSLEALVGFVDFDEAAQYKIHGSMLGSPSATSAYLMHASSWDDEAEAYLRSAVKNTAAAGGVPSVFPSPVFQISWIFTTMVRNGVFEHETDSKDFSRVVNFFESNLKQHGGAAGFAPGLVADVDDTSRSILAVHQAGRSVDLQPLIDTFEVKTHFKTYSSERNPSYGANCNVLLALLSSPEPGACSSQIEKVATFLCNAWKQGNATDKWNHSELYLNMLISEALVKLIERANTGVLTNLPDSLLFIDIPLVLSQILGSVVLSQLENGSWSNSVESTSYAILTIKYISELPWSDCPKLASVALRRGRAFLQSRPDRWAEAPYAWVGKVSYGSPILSEAYCLSAVNPATSNTSWSPEFAKKFQLPKDGAKRIASLLSQTPFWKGYSSDHVEILMTESVFYCKRLQASTLDVFPALDSSKTKYLDFIPFTWIACNRLHGSPLTSDAIWQMVVLGVLAFQADEYMETVLPQLPTCILDLLKSVIHEQCEPAIATKLPTPTLELPSISTATKSSEGSVKAEANFTQVLVTVRKLISFVLNNEAIQAASLGTHGLLATELRKFLIGHIDHVLDSRRMVEQAATCSETSQPSKSQIKENPLPLGEFFDWVHGTGSASGGVPLTLAFYCCLLSPSTGGDDQAHEMQQLATGRPLYLRQAISRHLAASCRLTNDYGSLKRDVAESNVNSLNFVELRPALPPQSSSDQDTNKQDPGPNGGKKENEASVAAATETAKQSLLDLAAFEDTCVDIAVKQLRDTSMGLDAKMLRAVDVFVAVTRLWGQMYVLKDLSNQIQRNEAV